MNRTVDDIDVESLRQPMRCSTPTPSNAPSTILASHLDFTLENDCIDSTIDTKEDNLEETVSENGSQAEFLNSILESYIPKSSKFIAAKSTGTSKEEPVLRKPTGMTLQEIGLS